LGQTPTQPTPSPSPRRPLPKPVAGSRGFEKYAGRDTSSRLIAGAATREVLDPAAPAYDRGEAAYAADKYKEAVEEFSEAVRLRPDWAQAHFALALSLTETEKLKEAIDEFKQVLKLTAKVELKILSYYNMGNAYADLGQYKEAIEAYQQAIKLNPKLSEPHYNLGLAYVASDQMPEAVAAFNQAVQLKDDYAEAHFNLGVAYLQVGKKHEAEEQQQLLVKLNPELAAKLDVLIKK
jgi:tetratricopeptide (TPR) repeat protein